MGARDHAKTFSFGHVLLLSKKPKMLKKSKIQPHTFSRARTLSGKFLTSIFLFIGFVLLITGMFSYTRGGTHTRVKAATSENLNFQARLYNASGSIVPDGDYNIEFKIYDSLAAGASAQGVCVGGGTDDCQWLETRTGANKVTVKNGYFSVNLGSVTSFPTSINWDQDLWITMNIGGTGAPSWDGEMSPRIKLTAVPYAFKAGGLTKNSGANNANLSFASSITNDPDIILPNIAGTNNVLLQSGTTLFTQGSVPFADSTGRLTQDNASFYWNNTTKKLGIGTSSPAASLSVGSASDFQASANDFRLIENGVSPSFYGIFDVGDLTASRTYTFPDATGTVCLTSGNCAGVGGTGDITGNGTAGTIAKFDAAKNIVDSIITESGSTITVTGTLNVTSSLQTAGTTRITNTGVLQNVSHADAGNFFSAGTLSVNRGGTGAGTFTANGVIFGNGTSALGVTAVGTNGQCLTSNGGGSAPTFQNCSAGTLQAAYNNSTNPELVLDATRGALTIRDNSTPIGANLLEVQNNAGSTTYLGVTATGTTVTGTLNVSGTVTLSGLGAGLVQSSAGGVLSSGAVDRNSATYFNTALGVTNGGTGTATAFTQGSLVFAGASGVYTQNNANLFWDNTNNTLGVGTTRTGAISATNPRVLIKGSGSSSATSALNIVNSSDTSLLYVRDNGQVGIGTTNTSAAFHVLSGQNLKFDSTTGLQVVTSGSAAWTNLGTTGSNPILQWYDGSNVALGRIDSNGNLGVGVGASNPTAALHTIASGAKTANYTGNLLTNTATSSTASINKYGLEIQSTGTWNGTSANNTGLYVSSVTGGTNNYDAIFNGGGNVGIGTAAPSQKLHIEAGGIRLGSTSNTNNVLDTAAQGGAPSGSLFWGNRTICDTVNGACAVGTPTLQSSYTASTGGSTPEIKLDSTRAALDIQDADTTIAGNLINVRASNGAGLGSILFSVNSTGQATLQNSANSTTALQVKNLAGTSLFTVDTTATKIKLGTGTPTLGNGTTGALYVSDAAEFAGRVLIGTASNGFDTTSGQVRYSGTYRNTKRIRLTAEYAGAVLDADGTNNTGTMSSAIDAANRMNYYKWTTSQASSQDYDIVIQVPLPQDFSAWSSSNPLAYSVYSSTTTINTIQQTITDSGGTNQTTTDITPSSTTTWETKNPTSLSSGTYTAGNYITIRIRLTSPQSGDVRIGNIYLDYLSNF